MSRGMYWLLLKATAFGVAIGWAYQDEINLVVEKAAEAGAKGIKMAITKVRGIQAKAQAAKHQTES